MMGLAAVAAIGALLYMRKKTDGAAVAGAGAVTSAATKPASWTSALAGLLAGASSAASAAGGATKPAAAVSDMTATSQPETANTKPMQVSGAQSPAPAFGGGGSKQITATVDEETWIRTYSDGSTEQLTPGEIHMYRLQKGGGVPFYAG